VFLIGYSCAQPKSEIDGLWVSAYQIQTEPNLGLAHYKKIMRIDGDSVFFKTTGEPKMEFDAWNIKSKFKRTSDKIETENEKLDKIFIHEISNDSLVISYKNKNATKEVFRKLKQPNLKVEWNPSNKSYEWTGNSSVVNTKFVDNGLFVNYLPENEDIYVGHWNTLSEKNNLFMVFDQLNIDAITVDSVKKNTAYLSLHNEEKHNYTFNEQNLITPVNLIGDWELVTCDTLRTENANLAKGLKWSTLDFLRISKDSILTKKRNVESTKKWTLGGTGNLIIIPDVAWKNDRTVRDTLTRKEKEVRRNIFKIESLSENELVLLTEYELVELNGFEIKLTYRRKN
jgi:hypothetical protein